MRVVFLGSPPFALGVLERLLASRHDVLAVVTRPDRPRGRGRKVERSPLVALAEERGVPVLQPAGTREEGFLERLRALEPDALAVASYGELLREDALELAPHGALNVHASLLPRWRGASPIQAAIRAGDATTGVSVQRMVRALDAGDVLVERETPIGPAETAGELLERLAPLGGDALVEALDGIEAGRARGAPQDEERVTWARKLDKDAGRVDWKLPAAELARHVRSVTPWPGAHTTAPDGRELALVAVRPLAEASALGAEPGTLVEAGGRVVVAAGEGALELVSVKPAGKRAMEAAAWLRGARFEPGARLGEA